MAGSQAGSTGGSDPASPLVFPELPRLELDVLLTQLVERAQEVMASQSRLRGLFAATNTIAANLALPEVLRRIVDSAQELIGARYAALGVIAADGHLSQFVHTGMDAEQVVRVGALPQGKGLLGAVIDDPEPIRLAVLGEDPRSSGFPPGHPPMRDFLGVPIRVRDEVFGNLYLTDKRGEGGFTREDEDLAVALAATAGAAIDNARLYEAAHTRGEWLRITAEITSRLLASDDLGGLRPVGAGEPADRGDPLRLIADAAREIAAADLVTVTLPEPAPTGEGEPGGQGAEGLRLHVASGAGADRLAGLRVPVAGTLAGAVFGSGQPARVSSPNERPEAIVASMGGLDIGPTLAMPLLGSRNAFGVLTISRLAGRPDFDADDLNMAASFANQASLALELAQARSEQHRAAMYAERDRIAADLHDHVIQQLFATGLALQGTASRLPPGPEADRLAGAVGDLDRTIKQIRTTIFQLHDLERAGQAANPGGLRSRLLGVVTELSGPLGFEPAVSFEGLLESILPGAVIDDLLAVLREALSNVARHARAAHATVAIAHRDGRLELRVSDDGVGMGDTARRSGLANLHQRAERHGGRMLISQREPTGTTLTWTVPSGSPG